MGATALTGANVFGTTTQYLSGSLSTVESGKVAYVYGAEASTNSAAVDTISNIENIDLSGANGINYVVGSAVANTITGGSGVDTISGGAGNDSITGGAGDDALTGGAGVDTYTRNGDATTDGSDTISDFTAGTSGDIIDLTTNGAQAAGAGAALTALESAATGAIAATTGLLIYTGNDLAAATEAGVEDLFDGTTTNFALNAAEDEIYLLASDGSNTYLFFLDCAAGNTEFTAADDVGTLMITFTGVTDATTLVGANFADFS